MPPIEPKKNCLSRFFGLSHPNGFSTLLLFSAPQSERRPSSFPILPSHYQYLRRRFLNPDSLVFLSALSSSDTVPHNERSYCNGSFASASRPHQFWWRSSPCDQFRVRGPRLSFSLTFRPANSHNGNTECNCTICASATPVTLRQWQPQGSDTWRCKVFASQRVSYPSPYSHIPASSRLSLLPIELN